MRTLLAVLLGVMFCSSPVSAQANKEAQKDFDALLARVKLSDQSVDFARLRRLYSQTDSYSAYGDDSKKEMYAALNSRDFKKSRSLAEEALKSNYLNVDAHLVKMVACDELADAKCSAHHKYVAHGIIDSIQASGDGKSPETALFVISVAEEYALARVLGLRVVGQSLLHVKEHSFDLLTLADPNTKAESKLYFNIDVIFAAEMRLFQKKDL